MIGKFKSLAVLVLLFSIAYGCKDNTAFLGTDQFNIQSGALAEGEHVKLIYYSGPDEDAETYLSQVIAVSIVSGDTFNILFPSNVSVEDESQSATFTFYSFKSPEYLHNITDKKYWESEENVLEHIKKVTRNPLHDQTAINTYPTCIGLPMKVISK